LPKHTDMGSMDTCVGYSVTLGWGGMDQNLIQITSTCYIWTYISVFVRRIRQYSFGSETEQIWLKIGQFKRYSLFIAKLEHTRKPAVLDVEISSHCCYDELVWIIPAFIWLYSPHRLVSLRVHSMFF